MYGIDITYIVLVVPAIIFSMIASSSVKSTFSKYSRETTRIGITGAQAAKQVLEANGIYDVRIEPVAGQLTDHYDPRDKVIRLSEPVYASSSTAALGVACHEAGHAIQYAEGYGPIKIRQAIIPVTNFASKLAVPLIVIGLLLSAAAYGFEWVAYLGVLLFAFSLLFQLVTLPAEFNASSRALKNLDSLGILDKNELQSTKKVLSAAAMTYVAALAVSVAQLLRFLVLIGGARRR